MFVIVLCEIRFFHHCLNHVIIVQVFLVSRVSEAMACLRLKRNLNPIEMKIHNKVQNDLGTGFHMNNSLMIFWRFLVLIHRAIGEAILVISDLL